MIAEGGLVAGRYRLDQPIGRGRAGMVWLAFDTRLHRTVTAKRMYVQPGLEPAAAENARAIALREGRAACRVTHDNAVTVHDALIDGDNVWLIMEYVPSRSMDEFLTEHGMLTPGQTAALGAALGSALAAAHRVGITHGSLEPANVLLADDGGVKITDFGISGAGPSPACRAPEVAAGAQAEQASDAFSLGATLYSAVEGLAPFGSDGQADQAPPRHSGMLTGALLKLLRTDPTMRPTVQDTVTALRAIGTGNESAFVPPTAPPGAQPFRQQLTAQSTERTQPQASNAAAWAPATAGTPPQQQGAPQPAPAAPKDGHSRRIPGWLVAVLAILAAVAVGILFTEFVIL